MPMDGEKLLGLLGLARRAGKLAIGFNAVDNLVRRGQNPLVVLAIDAGASQRNKVRGWSPVRGLVDDVLKGEELARAMGREKLVVVGVCDAGFVRGIRGLGTDDDTDAAPRKDAGRES